MAGISIIIITYNRPGDTLDLLESIVALQNRQEMLKELILVNNASTADYSVVKAYIDSCPDLPVKYLHAPGNLGVAGGRNFAVKYCTGDWILFLDDDVVIEDKQFLIKLKEAINTPFSDERPLGAMGCKVRYYDNRELQVNAFPHKNFEAYRDRPRFLTYYYVGCAHVISRKAWEEAGQYPTHFFYGMEEYDLGYRILEKGYCIGYDGSPEILHKESPLGRNPRPLQLSMMWVNKSIVAWKYLSIPHFLSTVLLWSGFYLMKSGFNLHFFFSSWPKIFRIPRSEKRTPLSKGTMNYLKAVGARLGF